MAAIVYDVVADENRDWNLNLIWFDKDDERVPLDGYGAICEVITDDGTSVARITHTSGITLNTTAGSEGEIYIKIPAASLNSPASFRCKWELVLHPTAADPTHDPVSLLRGKFRIREEIASLS